MRHRILHLKTASEPDKTPEFFASEQTQFTQLVATCIKTFHADLKVVVVGDLQLSVTLPTGISVVANLANLLTACNNEPDQVKALIKDYCQILAGIEGSLEKPRLNQIVPLIKTRTFIAQLSGEGPQKDKPKQKFATEDITQELSILYAINSDKTVAYLGADQVPSLNLEGKSLRSIAMDNLRTVLPRLNVRKHPQFPLFSMTAGGTLEASLLLIDELWDKSAYGIQGDIVVGIPAQGVLLFVDGADATMVKALRGRCSHIVAEGDHPMTETLFVRHQNGFVRLT